ncbi:organic cation transporter protein-like [Diadema antillarum]|uniref:organic cation transporter protein-like n=1 Tax=Diadema antillarum TaxID=105358 RepID=UPI003A84326C
MPKLDDILKDIGEFGPYQRRVFLICCIIIFFNSWISMITVFLSASMDHWCAVPEWDDFDCSGAGLTPDACAAAKRNASIPFNFTADGELVYEQCLKYNVSNVDFSPELFPQDYGVAPGEVIACDQGWEYDRSQYKSSIVTEFDLVCGNEDLTDISQSVFYGGYLVGSIVFGSLADIVGRWWTLMACLVLRLIAGVALAFSPTWPVYAVMRFFQGAAGISIYIITFVLGTEFVGPSKRNVVGIVVVIPFALGYMLLALLAYLLRYWKTLELVATAPTVAFLVLMFFLPESMRWQISQGKYEEAEKALRKVAESNDKSPSGPILSGEFVKEMESATKGRRKTGLDIFRTPRMRLRSVNIIFNWMVNVMVYHGLSLNTSNLGVDDYVAFAVSGAVEIPAYLLSVFIIELIGRRLSMFGCLLLGGVACLCTTFIPPGAALTTVAMIGKFGISASFAILYLYTVELYPTEIRTAAMGTCSMFARVAGIIAPIILTLDKYWTPLPLVIYGSASVLAGLLSLFFPETRGQKLPETMEDGENFGLNLEDKSENSGSLANGEKNGAPPEFSVIYSPEKEKEPVEQGTVNPGFSHQDGE